MPNQYIGQKVEARVITHVLSSRFLMVMVLSERVFRMLDMAINIKHLSDDSELWSQTVVMTMSTATNKARMFAVVVGTIPYDGRKPEMTESSTMYHMKVLT